MHLLLQSMSSRELVIDSLINPVLSLNVVAPHSDHVVHWYFNLVGLVCEYSLIYLAKFNAHVGVLELLFYGFLVVSAAVD